MNKALEFTFEIEGVKTRFAEKVFRCLHYGTALNKAIHGLILNEGFDLNNLDNYTPKLHTIRRDKEDVLHPGLEVELVFRSKGREHMKFGALTKIESTQNFIVKYLRKRGETKAQIFVDGVLIGETIWVHCQLKNCSSTLEALIRNDGFDSVNSFFEWFSEDFSGKIIHWTGLKY